MNKEILKIVHKHRETYLNILNDAITSVEREMIKSAHENPESKTPESDAHRLAIALIVKEMMAVNTLVLALKSGGNARSLLLINSFGQPIDLLSVELLKENEVFNIILDNINH